MKIVEIPKYAAAWDLLPKPTKSGRAFPAPHDGKSAERHGGATMDLEQLKILGSGGWAAVASQGFQPEPIQPAAVKVTVARGLPDMGMGYVGPASEKGEAQYISMPLDPHNQLKPIHEESVLYAYPFELVPSEPPPASHRPPEKFVEPPEWAPPATATSEPPPHLFRPAPSGPAFPAGRPQIQQEHHRGHEPQWHPPTRPALHPPRRTFSHHRTPSASGNQLSHSNSPASGAPPHGRPQHWPLHRHQSASHSVGDATVLPTTSDSPPPTGISWRRTNSQQQPPSPPRDVGSGLHSRLQSTAAGTSGSHHGRQQGPYQHHSAQQHYHRHYHHATRAPLQERRVSPTEQRAVDHRPHSTSPSLSTAGYQDYYQQPPARTGSPEVHFEAPLETWDPAKEPPPNTLPPSAYTQPVSTTVKNVWDMPRHQPQRRSPSPQEEHYEAKPHWFHHDYSTSDHSPAPLHPDAYPEDFFVPPTPPSIPSHLLREGHYQAIISENPEPDSTKVTTVFPWESQRRRAPGRVFPSADAPPPIVTALTGPSPMSGRVRQAEKPMVVAEVMTPSPTTVASVTSPILRPSSPKPKHVTRAYNYDWRSEGNVAGGDMHRALRANAWDTIPSIARYAKRLAEPVPGPSSVKPKEVGFPDKGWNEGIEESDAASHEADDEDDESDDGHPGSGAMTPVGTGRSGKRPGHTRTGSSGRGSKHVDKGVSTVYANKGIGTLQYRSQSVQTIPKSTQSRGVQVNRPPLGRRYRSESSASSASLVDRPVATVEPPFDTTRQRRTRSSGAVAFAPTPTDLPTRNVSPTASPPGGVVSPRMNDGPSFMAFREKLRSEGIAPSPTITTPAAEAFTQPPFTRTSMISAGTSSNRNSAAFSTGTNRDSLYTDTQTTPRSSVILSPTASINLPTPHIRTSSNETGLTGRTGTTPPDSVGPDSPQDDSTIRARRLPGRHWDSRRDVDIFKSQSQDVLARFLKMGGWEEEQKKKELRS